MRNTMKYCGDLIKEGSTDSVSIKMIKVRLNDLLGTKLDVNNPNFGPTTKEAVEKFQTQNQLLKDGTVGELTWERLFTVSEQLKHVSLVLRDRALEVADDYLFVREATGKNDGKEVEAFLKNVGLPSGYSWCAAYVYSVFKMAAVELGIDSPVPKTAGVLDLWGKAKKYRVTDPQPGDVFIMDFGGGKGHTGLITEVKGSRAYTNEGNTAADPTYAGQDRDGNGVFERNRPLSGFLGYLRFT